MTDLPRFSRDKLPVCLVQTTRFVTFFVFADDSEELITNHDDWTKL